MRFVRRAIAAIAISAMCVSVPSVCAVGPEAAVAEQMACCKARHHVCHKQGSAGGCCKKVGAASPSPVATATHFVAIAAPRAVPAIYVQDLTPSVGSPLAAPSIKRPHDPPHLHPFALLI